MAAPEAGVGEGVWPEPNGVTKCMGESVNTENGWYSSPAKVAQNPDCIAPISTDTGNIRKDLRRGGAAGSVFS